MKSSNALSQVSSLPDRPSREKSESQIIAELRLKRYRKLKALKAQLPEEKLAESTADKSIEELCLAYLNEDEGGGTVAEKPAVIAAPKKNGETKSGLYLKITRIAKLVSNTNAARQAIELTLNLSKRTNVPLHRQVLVRWTEHMSTLVNNRLESLDEDADMPSLQWLVSNADLVNTVKGEVMNEVREASAQRTGIYEREPTDSNPIIFNTTPNDTPQVPEAHIPEVEELADQAAIEEDDEPTVRIKRTPTASYPGISSTGIEAVDTEPDAPQHTSRTQGELLVLQVATEVRERLTVELNPTARRKVDEIISTYKVIAEGQGKEKALGTMRNLLKGLSRDEKAAVMLALDERIGKRTGEHTTAG